MKLILHFLTILLLPLFCFGQQFSFVTNLNSTVNETSGAIYLNNRLITHNDSGGDNALYELNLEDGTVIRTVTINNATNTDWEDITYDDEYIYIADIGNNNGDRTDLKVYKISISDYFDSDNTATAEAVSFNYVDQTDFTPRDLHDFDAEALISYNNNLYIFTKNRGSYGTTNIYTLSKVPGSHQASKVDSIDYSEGLITGSTYDSGSNTILLTGYTLDDSLNIDSSFIIEISNITSDVFSNGTIQRTSIEPPAGHSKQIESITRSDSNQYYLTAEQDDTGNSSLYWFNNAATALDVEDLRNDYSFTISNTITGFKIKASKPIFEIKVYDMLGRLLLQKNPYKNSFDLNVDKIKNGTILIVKLTLDDGAKLSRRIIKYY